MKYLQPTFTLPAAGNHVTQEEWDRIFSEEKRASTKDATRRTAPDRKDAD